MPRHDMEKRKMSRKDKATEILERLTAVMEALVQHEEDSEDEMMSRDGPALKEKGRMKAEFKAGMKSRTTDEMQAKAVTGTEPSMRRRILEISLFPNIYNKPYIG